MEFVYKVGNITDVFKDIGDLEILNSADSLIRLYQREKDAGLIYVPSVIGVHQVSEEHRWDNPIMRTHEITYEAFEEFIDRDTAAPSQLICLVYNNKAIQEDHLKECIKESYEGRIKLARFPNHPDFSSKEDIEKSVGKIMSREETHPTRKEIIEKADEIKRIGEKYGLTRKEEWLEGWLRDLSENHTIWKIS